MFKSSYSLAIGLVVVGSFLLFSVFSVSNHLNYRSAAFDLGIFDQAVWQYAQFKLPYSSLKQNLLWADHFSPLLAIFAPLYWLWSNPIMLLVAQAAIVSLSILPFFWLCRWLLPLSNKLGVLVYPPLVLSYVGFIGIQQAIGFDFHETTILVLPLMFLFYAYFTDKSKLFWGMVVLVLLVKEETPLLLIFLAFYDLLVKRRVQRGIILLSIALVYFLFVSFVVMPWLGSAMPAGGYIDAYQLGRTPREMMQFTLAQPFEVSQLLFNEPIKRDTWWVSLASFGFLPLMSGFSLVALPVYLARFLSVTELRWAMQFHYWAPVAPPLAVATVLGILRISGWVERCLHLKKQLASIGLSLGVLVCSLLIWFYYRPFVVSYKLTPTELRVVDEISAILSLIPPEASVSAQSPLVPHLSRRMGIYLFPNFSQQAEYVILSLDRTSYPLHFDELEETLAHLKKDVNHSLIAHYGNTYLFKKR